MGNRRSMLTPAEKRRQVRVITSSPSPSSAFSSRLSSSVSNLHEISFFASSPTIHNGVKGEQRKRTMKRIRSRFLSDEEVTSMDILHLQNKQKDLEAEIDSLRKLVEKLTQENQRSENERNRTFLAFQQQEEELNKWKIQHDADVEQINLLKNEMDKLYSSFKNYRESKESEIQQILKHKSRLESRLSRLGCYVPDEAPFERNSITEESVPPSPGFGSRADWFGSTEWDTASGSQTLLSNVDVMLRDELAALEESSFLRTAAVIALYVITDANYESFRNAFFTTYVSSLHKIVVNSGRVFKPVFVNSSFNHVEDLRELREATIFVSFVERSLSIQLRQKIRKIFLENEHAVLGVFCYPKSDGDRRTLSKLPVWDKVCVDSRSRLINDEGNRNRQIQLVFNEVEKFLRNDLRCRDLFEADEPQGYDEFLTCEEIILSNAFDTYSLCFDDSVFTEIIRKSEGHYLERSSYTEQLMNHVLSPGPMSPLLISGNPGCGVSTLLANWINHLCSVFNDSIFVLYHFVADRHSLAADPVVMLRRFNRILQTNLTPNAPSVYSTTKMSQDPEKIRQKFLQLLEKVSSRYTNGIVVIIDRIDLLEQSETTSVCFTWLLDPLPVDCRVVVSSHSSSCKSEWKSWPSFTVESFTIKEIPTWLNILTKRSDISIGEARQLATQFNNKLASVNELKTARALTLMSRSVASYGRSIINKLNDVKKFEDLCALILHKLVDGITAPIEQDILKKILLYLRYSRDGLSLFELFDLFPKLSMEKFTAWFIALYSFDFVRCVCGLYRLTSAEVSSAVHSVCSNKKLEHLNDDLFTYWKRQLHDGNVSWRTVDQLLFNFKSNSSRSRDEYRKFLLRPDVFVCFMKRGLSSQLLEIWHNSYGCDKTTLASTYTDSWQHDEWPACVRGDAYLGLSVISHELELGTMASQKILETAKELYLSIAPNDHPVLALISHEMAHCYMQSGRFNDAELLLKRAEQTFSTLFGPYHRTVEIEMETLVQVYRFQNKTKLADQIDRQIIQLRNNRQQNDARLHVSRRLQELHQRSTGELSSTLETVKILTELGMLHYYRGSLDVAEEVLRKALETKESLMGADSHELFKELTNFATVLTRKKCWDQAEIAYKRLLNLKQKTIPRDENSIRAVQQQLVNIFLKLNKINEAEPILCELAEYFRTSVVRQPARLVLILCHLAVVYCEQGLHDRAEPILDEASRVCREQLPTGHKLSSKVQKIYAKLYFEVGNIEQAARIFMQSSCSSGSQSASRKSSSSMQSSVHTLLPPLPTPQTFSLAPPPPGRLRKASSGL